MVVDAPQPKLPYRTTRDEVASLAPDLEDARELPRVGEVEVLDDADRKYDLVGSLPVTRDRTCNRRRTSDVRKAWRPRGDHGEAGVRVGAVYQSCLYVRTVGVPVREVARRGSAPCTILRGEYVPQCSS